MHLQTLELMGFKSFGHKTVFEFQPGITGIIGPNGSGKSNICDAIRWVLGEQSAKTLRGTKMSEVIFAGTPQIRPSAFAQVRLVLNNEDRLMPVEYSEVSIGRQLFRSGESNYFLNSGKSLLSDLKEMLMDTGIGKDGYSVIGQGDIDDIVFQRTQSRRALIEEAAGITKFKHRKANTLQKLDHTRANITRLRDIVGEIELQLGPLAEQAEKTRRYQALAAEIRGLEIDLILFDLSQLYADHENVDSMRRGLIAKVAEIDKFLEEVSRKKADARERLLKYEEGLKSQRDELRDTVQGIDSIRSRVSSMKEESRSHQARRQAIVEEVVQIDTMLDEGGREIEIAENQLKDEEAREITLSGKISEIDSNIAKVQGELDQHLKEIAQDRESSFQVAVLLTDKKNRINTATQQISLLEKQLEKGAGDITSLENQIARLETEKTRLTTEMAAMESEISANTKSLQEDQQRQARVEKDLKKSEEELSGTGDQIKILNARRNLLEELKNGAESGISRGTREILALKDRQLPGVFGMVGDLVTVPRGYETAFEVALGGSIQDIVTRDAQTSQQAIAILKERKAGRATFLPLDMIQAAPRLDSCSAKGCLGVALDLIQYDAKFYSVMNYLFGRILIFQDLDSAVAYSRTSRNFSRIVTLEGDIVRSSGAMTGGAEGARNPGLLTRRRELDELGEKLQSLAAAEKKLRGAVTRLQSERTALLTTIRQREDAIAKRRNSFDFFKNSLEKQETDLVTRRREFQTLDVDRRDLQSELTRLQKSLVDTRKELTALEAQNVELSARLQELSGKENGIQSRLVSLRGMMNEERLVMAQIAERKKGLRKEIDSAGKRRRDAQDRKNRAGAEIGRLEASVAEIEKMIAEQQVLFADLERKKNELEAQVEAKQNEHKNVSREIEGYDHTFQSRAKIQDATKNKLAELDVKLAEIKTHIKNKESILAGDFQFEMDQTSTTLRKYESREELVTRIAARRGEMEALEPVNPLAIEDYEKTKERFDFLNGQIRDMTEAATSLEQVIAEIEKISCERFLQTFQLIDGAFSDIFNILFPGGGGHLKLSNGDDPLNSNVEIICQLPGKKLSTIELFSGGEKALISIALLFSILQVKPPAFCVLDEIEASLDEANVRRFTRLLRSFADKTQFLVITHNKETMQAVDVIYGITLEKTGISRQISIRLEDQDKIKEFTVGKKPLSGTERPPATVTNINDIRQIQENSR